MPLFLGGIFAYTGVIYMHYVFRANINGTQYIIVDNDIKFPLIEEVEYGIYNTQYPISKTLSGISERVLTSDRSDYISLNEFIDWLNVIADHEFGVNSPKLKNLEINEYTSKELEELFNGYHNILDFIFKLSLINAGFNGA